MKRSSTSPQSRSHLWLKERGFIYGKTEQNVTIPDLSCPTGKRMFKRDLFGFCDIAACHPEQKGIWFIQVTGGMNNKSERLAKMEANPNIPVLLRAGNTIELQVWRKLGPKLKKRWTVYRCQARMNGGKITWQEVNEDDDDEDFETQTALFPSAGNFRIPA